MNRVFKVMFNKTLGVYTAVSELAVVKGKKSLKAAALGAAVAMAVSGPALGNNSPVVYDGEAVFARPQAGSLSYDGKRVVYNSGLHVYESSTGTGGLLTLSNGTLEANGAEAFGDNTAVTSGGAFYLKNSTSTVLDSYIVRNSVTGTDNSQSGGAVFASGGTLAIENTKFSTNSAGYDATRQTKTDGGALKVTGGVETTITDGSFTSNKAGMGGAVSQGTKSGKLVVSGTEFTSNTAHSAGAMSVMAETDISNAKFISNTAELGLTFSGVPGGGGALFLGSDSSTKISGSVFTGNTSATLDGGAIDTRKGSDGNNANAKLDISGSIFSGNSAKENGGAINNSFYSSVENENAVTIKNTSFQSNEAKKGGAVYSEYSGAVAAQAGKKAAIDFTEVTFTGNTATDAGGALYLKDSVTNIKSSSFDYNKLTDTNNAGSGGAVFATGGTLNISNTDFTGNTAGFSESQTGSDIPWSDGGALKVTGGAVTTVTGGTFKENTADLGGAVSQGTKSGKLTVSGTSFESNKAHTGGAMSVMAATDISGASFTGNTATDAGGALFLGAESATKITGSAFTGNESQTASGGAIDTRKGNAGNNAKAKLDIADSTFTGNTAKENGGAINNSFYSSVENENAVTVKNTTFEANKAKKGGAVYSEYTGTVAATTGKKAAIDFTEATFTGNTATDAGGALYLKDSATNIKGSAFSSNTVTGSDAGRSGGAVFATGGTLNISNTGFTGNTAGFSESQTGSDIPWSDGGALKLTGGVGTSVSGGTFKENTADLGGAVSQGTKSGKLWVSGTSFESNKAHTGGAMSVMAATYFSWASFTGNTVSGDTDGGGALFLGADSATVMVATRFDNNKSLTASGGAIDTRKGDVGNNAKAKLDIISSNFTGNSAAENGGAINNSFYSSAENENAVTVRNTTFEANKAKKGGAVYSEYSGTVAATTGKKAAIDFTEVTFTGNTATDAGGALYLKDSVTNIKDSAFSSNTVTGTDSSQSGGAVFASGGTLAIEDATFLTNSAGYDASRQTKTDGGAVKVTGGVETTITGGSFTSNKAGMGGAVSQGTKSGKLVVSGTEFTYNTAHSAGAISVMAETDISNAKFILNTAELGLTFSGVPGGGGALFLGSDSSTKISGSEFTGNKSDALDGGAIDTRKGSDGNNTKAKLDISGSTFSGNSAKENGGALSNSFYGSAEETDAVTVKNTVFENNTAANGAAVYNDYSGAKAPAGQNAVIAFTDVTFTGNTATTAGGALYNSGRGEVRLRGTNTFTGNTAGGVANDIHNDGTVRVMSGLTTLSSGTTGTGNLSLEGGRLVASQIGSNTVSLSGGTLETYTGQVLVNALDETGLVVTDAGALRDMMTVTSGELVFADENYNLDYVKSVSALVTNSTKVTMLGTLVDAGSETRLNLSDISGANISLLKVDLYSEGNNLIIGGTDPQGGDSSYGGNVGAQTIEMESGDNVTVTGGKELTLAGDGKNLVTSGDSETVDLTIGTDDAPGKLTLGSDTGAKGGELNGSVTVNDGSEMNVKGGEFGANEVGLNGEDAQLNMGSNAKLTTKTLKLNEGADANIAGGATLDAGTLTANDGTTISVGSGESAGALVAENATLNGGDAELNLTGAGTTADVGNLTLNEGADATVSGGATLTADTLTANDGTTISVGNGESAGALVAGNATLNGGDAELNLTGAGTTADVGNLTLNDGADANIAGGATLHADTLTANDGTTISVGSGESAGALVVGNATLNGGDAELNLTGAGTTADVGNLSLNDGADATVSGGATLTADTLTAHEGTTISVGSDESAGTLISRNTNLNGATVFLNPEFKDGVGIEGASKAALVMKDDTVDGKIAVGRNAVAVLGSDDTSLGQKYFSETGRTWGPGEGDISAALVVTKNHKLDSSNGSIVVDGTMTSSSLPSAGAGRLRAAAAQQDNNQVRFADNSMLIVDAKGLDGKAAISGNGESKAQIGDKAALHVTNAKAGKTMVLDGFGDIDIKDGWSGRNLTSSDAMLSLSRTDGEDGTIAVNAKRNDAGSALPGLGLTNSMNNIWDAGMNDVDSTDAGIRLLSRAADERFMDRLDAARQINGAAQIAVAGGVQAASIQAMGAVADALNEHLSLSTNVSQAGVPTMHKEGVDLWAAMLYRDSDSSGLKAGNFRGDYDNHFGGLVVGMDYNWKDVGGGSARIGAAINAGKGDANSQGDFNHTKNEYDTWGMNIYGGWNNENINVVADFGYMKGEHDLKQGMPAALGGKLDADVDSKVWTAGLRGEYLFRTSVMDIMPHLGVRYTHLKLDSFRTKNAYGTVFDTASSSQNVWQFPVGVTLSKNYTSSCGWTMKPLFDLSVIPAAGDKDAKTRVSVGGLNTGDSFSAEVMDSFSWRTGIGLEMQKGASTVGVKAGYQKSSDERSRGFSITYGHQF